MDSQWYPEERGGYGGERGRPDERGYGDDRGYPPRYGDERDYPEQYRVPEPRPAPGGRGYGETPGYGEAPAYGEPAGGQFGPRSGEPLPPAGAPMSGAPTAGATALTRPPGEASNLTGELPVDDVSRARRAEPVDRASLHRPAGPAAADPGGAVYTSKRPGLAALLIALTVLFELPVLRMFASSALASKVDNGGTVASIFMIFGLPMFALGLFALISGAAAAPGARVWLRTPLAYLPISLLLFLAAALAG